MVHILQKAPEMVVLFVSTTIFKFELWAPLKQVEKMSIEIHWGYFITT